MSSELWTWGGTYFGRREGEDLWTHSGHHVGRFHGDEVFGSDGRYLGKIKSGKLITQLLSQTRRGHSFAPYASRAGHVPYVGHIGTVMYSGYEDFPDPETFK